MARDITDPQRVEGALRASEEQLLLFVEHAPAAIAMFDRDMRYLAVSRRFLSDYRLSLRDVIGRSHYEIFPEIPERWKDIHRRCLAGTVERCDEDPFPRADGTLDWVRWEIHPWRDAVGGIGGIILFSEVITERKRNVEALRESEERFRLLVQGVKDCAIYMLAPNGTVTSWSGAAEQIFGYREEEIIGQHRAIFFTEEDRRAGQPQKDLEEAAAHGLCEQEAWRVRKDGSLFWANVLITALRDDAGRLRGFASVFRDFTDRKRAEEELRASEERMRLAHEVARVGTFERDIRTGVDTWTPELEALYGLPRGTGAMSPPVFERLIHPDDLAAVLREGERAREMGEAAEAEWRVVWPDGSVHWIAGRWRVLKDASGAPQRIAGINIDITERKRAEQALRESEERLRLAQQVAHVGTFEWNIQTGVNTWTPELEAMYGLPRGGFAGTEAAWESRVHPDDRADAVRQVEEAIETGAPIEVEWRVVWPDGSVHWLAGRAQVFKDASGKPLRLTGINIDITERKAAEHALRAKEAELALILDRTPFMLTRCSRDLRYRYVSGAYAKMIGRTPDQVAGRPVIEILGEEGFETIRPRVEAVLRGEPVEYEDDVHFEGVGPRRLQVIYVPDRDEQDRVVGWIANIVDVTERRQAEALRAANMQLLEADRNRTEFLAMLSHELRNPLAPIRNSLYILGRVAPGGEQARHAQTVIERQVWQMTRLIDDLLDVTRVTRGKIRLQREALDLNDLVQRTVDDHRTLFSKNEIRLEMLPAPLEVPVNGDRVRLAQAIGNLLQNAAKFTPGGGTTTVSVEADSARGEAVLTVRDTGSGIQPDMLARLFHPFTQADATLDRSKGGLGLGLALVKGLAELHGGSVSAASAGRGQGAAFTIRLHLDTSAARAIPLQRAEAGARGAPRRILVIEDNEDAAQSLRDVLELDEHLVEVAFSGRGGIEKARSFHPDVVLCDIGLPEMDGYEVARAMRADPELRRIRLIAVSGYAQPEDVAMATEAGFDAHLAKPPSIDTLERVLAEVGSMRHDQPASPRA